SLARRWSRCSTVSSLLSTKRVCRTSFHDGHLYPQRKCSGHIKGASGHAVSQPYHTIPAASGCHRSREDTRAARIEFSRPVADVVG
ncbi:MAG: hypothetical protein M3003_12870, partial [Candidatus Dormibacteraeota bacterium]|nr:hypothetical protein [Candidatus Dormibacteraeota bacterium]